MPVTTNDLTYLAPAINAVDLAWQDFLYTHCGDLLKDIDSKLTALAKTAIIYPAVPNIFKALALTPLANVKVVILGQDPYHGLDEANGLAFAVADGVKTPPSLRNIFKELAGEFMVDFNALKPGLLTSWALDGVLLLNSSLTVIKDKPNSLAAVGWHELTDRLIKHISGRLSNVVFMLWGNFAKQKGALIDETSHLVLKSTHPSPFSAHNGFLGCNHFVMANQYLVSKNITPINWTRSPQPGNAVML